MTLSLRAVAVTLSLLLAGPAAANAPAVEPAPVAEKDSETFPRYKLLKPAVAFWTKVFRDYSEHQVILHSEDFPNKIYQVIDLRDEAQTLSPVALAKKRQSAEKQTKAALVHRLRAVHTKRNAPDLLTPEERELYELYEDVKDEDKFLHASQAVRSQRGLKERTAQALETSRQYLPEMERIFKSYGLPVALTRLPLVESSFNIEAYSKVGAAGLWQFIPSSARHYMRLNEVVDDRRDPWTSTDGAARHLRDDYAALGSWPLALTAYNHGRSGVAKALKKIDGSSLTDLVARYESRSFGFASRNFYAEFLAALDVEREWRKTHGKSNTPLRFDQAETAHYVPYPTLVKLSGADEATFRSLNPAFTREVVEGKLYVPPQHSIRVPDGRGKAFAAAYGNLSDDQRFSKQRAFYRMHKVKKGEALSRIAKRYGVSTKAIAQANGIKKTKHLRAGQVIKIPPPN